MSRVQRGSDLFTNFLAGLLKAGERGQEGVEFYVKTVYEQYAGNLAAPAAQAIALVLSNIRKDAQPAFTALLDELSQLLYEPVEARKRFMRIKAENLGSFYKSLTDLGFQHEDAMKLVCIEAANKPVLQRLAESYRDSGKANKRETTDEA